MPKLNRLLAPAFALVLLSPLPAALAASADIALLQSFAGTWRGAGQLTGGESGNMSCRLTLTPREERLNFSGRCSLDGSIAQSFRGVLHFNEQTGRFEATSSDGTVAGRKSGGGIVFVMSGSSSRGAVDSTMTLRGDAISIDIHFVDGRTDRASQGSVHFARS